MLHVLIVDDEYPVHEALLCMLDWREMGYEIPDSAMDGTQALEMMRQNHYQVVITDIRMPNTDGLALMNAMKAISPGVQVLVISGYDLFAYVQEALRCGARDYLLKPLDRHELKARMEQLSGEILQNQGSGETKTMATDGRREIHRVIDYLDSCFRTEITVSEIAKTFYLNPSYIGQQFRKATGMTINDFINRKRIDWIKRAVQVEHMYAQEAIHQAGYQNCSYFYRKFQEMEGMSFQQWRQQVR